MWQRVGREKQPRKPGHVRSPNTATDRSRRAVVSRQKPRSSRAAPSGAALGSIELAHYLALSRFTWRFDFGLSKYFEIAFHNGHSATLTCRRKVEMSPVAQSRNDTPIGDGHDEHDLDCIPAVKV